MFHSAIPTSTATSGNALPAGRQTLASSSSSAPVFTAGSGVDPSAASVTRSSRTVQVGTRKAPLLLRYDIESAGSGAAAAALFPEEKPPLDHQPISEQSYRAAVDRLRPEQRQALRTWAALDDVAEGTYHDGTPVVDEGLNYELNNALTEGHLTPPFAAAAQHLDAGLAAMPSFPARLTRVAEHGESNPSPWRTKIAIGDVVTPGPRFMSASDNHRYSIENLSGGRASGSCLGEDTDTLVFYSLDASSGVPLRNGSLAANKEQEWLFRPGSAFRVRGIAQATPHEASAAGSSDDNAPVKRVGVHLEELVGYRGPAKNIYDGEPVDVPTTFPAAR